jgi:Nickel/cobalt transporter regulator
MLRKFVLVATFALALPTIAAAQQHDDHKAGPPHPGPPHPAFKPPPPHGPVGGPTHPAFKPGPPHGPIGGPPHPPGPPAAFVHPGPGGPQFTFHGRAFNRIHIHPFIYPPGWAYRQWAIGAILPPLFLVPDYYYPEWAALGLEPPPPGDQWVRYGPDLLLVNIATGQVVDVAYGVFYDD